MDLSQDYLYVDGSTTIEHVLRTYLAREGQWWWLLVSQRDSAYVVCSFGSLLPYLTGRTGHIVHNIGDCPICSSMDPRLWRDTGTLVQEALADTAICSRLVADLPMAGLLVYEIGQQGAESIWIWLTKQRSCVCAVTEDGAFSGVYVMVMLGDSGGVPAF